MKALAATLLVLVLSAPVQAALSPTQLNAVRVDATPDARPPLALRFADEHGATRTLSEVIGGAPAVLVFADYTCTNLCGPILAFAADGLGKSGLTPGKDFHLVVVGLDPKDRPEAARAMKSSRVGDGGTLAAATIMLVGTPDVIHAATQAAGYHYVYDSEHDQFAHPAAAFVLANDGRIVRALSGLGLSGDNLRLALVDAGEGRVGSLRDQITLRCFGFDPAQGIYTATIERTLAMASAATALVLAAGIVLTALRMRRGRQA